MKFKRIIKYVCPVGIGNFLTGDIDEQTLIYEQLDRNRWMRRYVNFKRGRAQDGSIEEFENTLTLVDAGTLIVAEFPANDVGALILPTTTYPKALIIRGAFDYESDDILKDDFGARCRLKEQLQEKLRQAFDAERERTRKEKAQLDDLLKRYEHLPIKG